MRILSPAVRDLITRLSGKLLSELGEKGRTGNLRGKVPKAIQRRVDSFNMFRHTWAAADYDILVLVAMAEEMWDRAIAPLNRLQQDQLQLRYGVNALSRTATRSALTAMRDERKVLDIMRLQCEAMRPLAQTLAQRSVLGGPANASQILLDRQGAGQVEELCKRNEAALKKILSRFDLAISANEDVLRAHGDPGR